MAADLRLEVDEWTKRGADLRSKLEARRKELVRELEEVNAQLKVMPRFEPASLPEEKTNSDAKFTQSLAFSIATEVRSLARELTLPAYIKSILEHAPGREMKSKVLVHRVAADRGLDTTRVHSELFRMKERKQISARGDRPHTVYFLPPQEAHVSP